VKKYKIEFHPDVISKDFPKLAEDVKKRLKSQLRKLSQNPYCGESLRHKLKGYRKLYFDKKRYRIIYRIIEEKIIIFVIAVGKRDKLEVYKISDKRVELLKISKNHSK